VLTVALGSGIVQGCAIALVAISFTLILNATRVINFANASMMLAGGYASWQVHTELGEPFALALAAGLAAGMLVGALIELVILRVARRSDLLGQVLALVALTTVATALAQRVFGPEPKALRRYAGTSQLVESLNWSATDLVIIAVSLATVGTLTVVVFRTSVGLALRATASDGVGAALAGINPHRVALGAWLVGGALAALAGMLLFPTGLLTPTSGFSLTLTAFAAVVLGGVGSYGGAIAGGIAIGMANSLVAAYIAAGYEPLVSFVVMLVVLAVRPAGLLGAKA
jgi:branched-subunit amino acid ABC-type transport system permease component